MKPMFRWYLIGVVVAFGGIFLLWPLHVNEVAVGETVGALLIPAGLCYWVYTRLKREEEAKKKGQGGSP